MKSWRYSENDGGQLDQGRTAAEEGLPALDEILGCRWHQVTAKWPALQEQVEILRTEPPRSRSGSTGPWRIVAVREPGASGCRQIVLAREYW
ncbi:MAG: hypothetical protein GX855_08685 [Firmicutes bacterium]|nr:hypothetical protein [Bacillota bacterium]